ncbi:ZIP family metal transporter [Flavobacterium sp.]|jgi:zinc transporter ZupT|uniref:ZIP family metal transporter n=1 Tax=Flavobacterium sp. TaxID=239 RepID=UPI0022CA860E|nr:ZIP family metal transporter [Flavobacterium sp.]MCZ8167662.1 ZIP family metal transporter [Flavobacterium sp.]MCZ8295737.1 ZIP family metal transporter [Flavobacterium sp.]
MNYILPLLSVLLGFGVALWWQPQGKKNLKLLLAFSGSFLLSLTVINLLPEVYADGAQFHTGVFIMVGIVFQIFLEFFSKGAEHGHVHGHEKIQIMPWSLFISLCLHALLEGFPVGHHQHLAFGIAIHHFPIAMILTLFFLKAGMSKKLLLVFMIGFALMTPLGTVLADSAPMLKTYYQEITAVVIGILFHISSTIIFESSEGHKFNVAKITVIIFGVIMASLL